MKVEIYMANRFEWPLEDELVVCTVKRVLDYGAFVTLDEYQDKEGFIHIAEIASGWVKYIGNHIREKAKVVTKVLRVDPRREHIDLSLKRVNDHQKRAKIQEWRRNTKMLKLFELLSKRIEKELKLCYREFGFSLMEKYGSLYNSFEAVSINNNVLEEDGFQGDWVEHFVDIARTNITPPYVSISEKIYLFSPAPNGVEHVKEAIGSVIKNSEENVKITYVGAPEYRISVIARDYKNAESVMANTAGDVIDKITSTGGYGSFDR